MLHMLFFRFNTMQIVTWVLKGYPQIISWLLVAALNTYHVTVLGWLKKEERKKEKGKKNVQLLLVCHYTHRYYYCRLVQALYKLLCVLLNEIICSQGDDITV